MEIFFVSVQKMFYVFFFRIIDLKHQRHIDLKNIVVDRAAQVMEERMKHLKRINSTKEEQFQKRIKMIRQNELK